MDLQLVAEQVKIFGYLHTEHHRVRLYIFLPACLPGCTSRVRAHTSQAYKVYVHSPPIRVLD